MSVVVNERCYALSNSPPRWDNVVGGQHGIMSATNESRANKDKCISCFHWLCAKTPNDPKLSDGLGDVRLRLRDIRLGEVSARTLVNVGNLNVIVLLAVLHNKGKHRLATLNAQRRRVEHTPVCDEGDG